MIESPPLYSDWHLKHKNKNTTYTPQKLTAETHGKMVAGRASFHFGFGPNFWRELLGSGRNGSESFDLGCTFNLW